MALEDEKQKLALRHGKAMAQRALDGLTMTDEEKQQRDEEDAAKRKLLLIKVVLGATAVVVVGITLMNLFAKLWIYLVALVIMAGVGGAGYVVLKPKLKAWNDKRTEGARLQAAERQAQEQVAAAEKQKLLAQKKLDDDLARLRQQL